MSPYSILVVDDEEPMRKLCGRILRGMGYEAVFAQTLAEVRDKSGSLARLDLLVTDLKLPDGSGLDVIRAARAKFPAVGVVVITAYLSLETHRGEFQSLGVSEADMLSKPFEVARFEAAVKSKLPAPPAEGRGAPVVPGLPE